MDRQKKAVCRADKVGKPRPALFRALGRQEPPETLQIDGRTFSRDRVFKHDSWAATALYQHQEESMVVKFNRQQPVFGIPMKWLGRMLASRERSMLMRLADVDNVPRGCGQIIVDGKACRTADGHEFVPGQPLRPGDRPDDQFFDRFRTLLTKIHERDIAYVDLHKCENILVGDDGEPYLFDFQISMFLPRVWPFSTMLSILQQSDDYHLAKHVNYFRPDQSSDAFKDGSARPWWIKAHRCVGVPVRQARRRLLVLLGIRKGNGQAHSEFAPEDGKRSMTAS